MNYDDLTPTEKSRALDNAAINCSPEEITDICKELGQLEYSAKALGIACRFRGVECVKALVEGGASFYAPLTNYMVETYGSYGDNLSVMLLEKYPMQVIPYFVIARQFINEVKQDSGNVLTPLSFEKRIEVLDYLCENSEKACFDMGELLYYAIIFKDKKMQGELEKRGAEFSEYRVKMLSDKGERCDLYIWSGALQLLRADDFVPVLSSIMKYMRGEKLHNTNGIYCACLDCLYSYENLKFYFDNFDTPKVNKTNIMELAVRRNNAGGLKFAAEQGWLKAPKKRDEMIEYAEGMDSPECRAFLLDFKNSTADLVKERSKAEKKEQRELNAAPDSVTALKLLWNYKKGEDGNIIITGYKGKQTVISVPPKIGKNAVTAIGKEAFSPKAARIDDKARDVRKEITEIRLPDSIKEIGNAAFSGCEKLRLVNIPIGVEKIPDFAFMDCHKLEKIEIPGSVRSVGQYAFVECEKIKEVVIAEGTVEIGQSAFIFCRSVERIELPKSLKVISNNPSTWRKDIFAYCESLKNIIVPKGSYAEEYCKKHELKYTYREEK
ncbi:MAG: leucine-rich repeat domain-containing protein [Ruminococcaceae bacterium]|nr:leucine-rich repeat domain-containing protein [Oscillospiraceae bacterium]